MIKAYQKYSIEIKQNYEELLYDEYPYLFIGKNIFGEIIIGSFIDDDEEQQIETYFHLLVDKKSLADYFQKKISYHKLMKKANSIYVVSKNYRSVIIDVEKVNFKDIKKDILPSKSSFYRLETIPKVIEDFKNEMVIIIANTIKIHESSTLIKDKEINLSTKKYVQTDLQLS